MKARKDNSEELHTAFQVGNEYDAQQLAFERYNIQVLEKTLTALEQKVLREKLDAASVNYHCSCVKNEIERAVSTEIHLLQNKADQLDVHTDIYNADHIEQHYKARSDYHVHQEQMKVDKRFNRLKKQQTRLEFIKTEIQNKEDIVDTYDNPPLVRSLFNIKFIYLFTLGGFALGDAILSFNAMQVLGEGVPNIALLWLTGLTALGVGVGAHFTGDAMAKKGLSKPFWAAFLISIFFVFILIALRIDGASMTLSLLNLAFYGIACLISYKRSLTSEYWSICSRLRVLKKRLAYSENKLLVEQKALEAETNSVLLSVRHWVDSETAEDVLFNKIKNVNLTNAISGMTKILNGYCAHVEIIRTNALAQVSLREERKKRNSISVPDFGITAKIKSLFASAMVALCLVSCSHNVETTDAVVLFDLTENQALPDIETVISHLGIMDAGTVRFSAISDRHAYQYRIVSLPGPKHFLEAVKEEEDLRLSNFEKDLKTAYNALPLPIEEPKQSLVFSSLSQNFKALSETKHSKKKLVIYSDLLQYQKAGINFYKYRKNPKQLLAEYDEILSMFKAEHSPEHVSDLSVEIYHTPVSENDELWRFQQVFYTKLFKDHGATMVQFHPFIKQDNIIAQTH